MRYKIPLFKICWDEEDVRSVSRIIRRGMHWAAGPEVDEFEKIVADFIGRRYAVAFNSGTSALHATMLACGVKENHEVIVPSFTFIATANATLFVGARPVFADIEDKTFGLDPESVKENITAKTKAIIAVHYGGLPCQIRDLRELAEDHGLIFIEDAAESIGASVNEKKVGLFSDIAVFSFCSNKVVTTGEGGMAVLDSKDIYEKLKLIRSHGRLELEPYFTTTKTLDYVTLGYNWRMSSINATLGISQMKKIRKLIDMRRQNASYLSRQIGKVANIQPPGEPDGHYHVYQMYTIRVNAGEKVRDALKEYLASKGIMTKVYFEPVHLSYFYRERFGYKGGELPITENLSKKVLTLPMYPTLTKNEMNYVARCIKSFMNDYK